MRDTADPASQAAAEPEVARAPPNGLATSAFGGVLALQRAAGNRATVRALGIARAPQATKVLPFDQEIFASKIGEEAAGAGQMLFHSRLWALVIPKAEAEVNRRPELVPIWKEWLDSMNEGAWESADSARKKLRELAPTGPLAALHGPDEGRMVAGGPIFERLWKQFEKPDSPFPDLTPYATISQYQVLRRFEMQDSNVTATKIAKRYIAAGGVGGKRRAETAIKSTPLVAGVKRDKTPLGGDLFRGDVAS